MALLDLKPVQQTLDVIGSCILYNIGVYPKKKDKDISEKHLLDVTFLLWYVVFLPHFGLTRVSVIYFEKARKHIFFCISS